MDSKGEKEGGGGGRIREAGAAIHTWQITEESHGQHRVLCPGPAAPLSGRKSRKGAYGYI